MNNESIIRPNWNGTPAVHGTRLTVYSIIDHYFAGATPGEIDDFDRITTDEAASAIDYINSHMTELMPTYREMLSRDSQGNPAGVNELLSAAHAKLVDLQAELQGQRGRAEDASVVR